MILGTPPNKLLRSRSYCLEPPPEDELLSDTSKARPETVSWIPQALGRTTATAGEGSDKSNSVDPAQDAPDNQDVYWLVLSKNMFEAS